VQPAGAKPFGTPWLVLRGRDTQAVLWNGPVLELAGAPPRAIGRLGPDIMRDPPDIGGMMLRLRAADQSREIGEAVLDQRLVAGIGNMWKAESLFEAGMSPWAGLDELSDERLQQVLTTASRLMRGGRRKRAVYRRAGLPCRRCSAPVRSAPQGDNVRTAYWCLSCQRLLSQ
jgi:endonuclease-8